MEREERVHATTDGRMMQRSRILTVLVTASLGRFADLIPIMAAGGGVVTGVRYVVSMAPG